MCCYAGHVSAGSYRINGSSGGYTSWLLCELLNRGEIDAVLHVRQRETTEDDDRLFAYSVSHSQEEICANAKSRYYPVSLADVLGLIRDNQGSYAITGVPCFIKAVRLLQLRDEALAQRIRYCIGLVCGHLKSRRFADLLGWQLGIEPGRLARIDFRHKLPDYPASRYGTRVEGLAANEQHIEAISAMGDLIGGDWGVGYFKYKACSFCDDVLAETADIAVGDAWLPQYVKDSMGANVVVVRDPKLKSITEEAIKRGDLVFDKVSADVVMHSQAAGLRDRRSGLAYRLYKTDKAGQWAPKKRVASKPYLLDRWFRKQQDLRNSLSSESHAAFERALAQGSVTAFKDELEPALSQYYAHLKRPTELIRRVLKKAVFALSHKLNFSIERTYER